MNKTIRIIIKSVFALFLFIHILIYTLDVKRDSFYHNLHFITIFTEEIGWSVNSHSEVYIVPKLKFFLAFIEFYDYIKMIEPDEKIIAIENDNLYMYIPPNKVFVRQNGKSYEVSEKTITHLKNFSGFDNLTLYFGNDEIKKQFLKDTEQLWIKRHTY